MIVALLSFTLAIRLSVVSINSTDKDRVICGLVGQGRKKKKYIYIYIYKNTAVLVVQKLTHTDRSNQ